MSARNDASAVDVLMELVERLAAHELAAPSSPNTPAVDRLILIGLRGAATA
jgi:hypothetical protein